MSNNIAEMDASLREFFSTQKLLPILTVDDQSVCKDLADIFCEVGLTTFEITLRTEISLEVITEISSLGNFIVGAGTLISPSDVRLAIKAGAKFGVTPGITPELLDECERNCFPVIPGVSTGSEIMSAYVRGYKIFKFFPAEMLGGVKALKAFFGPFPNCEFIPTGGINQQNVQDYFSLPNVYGVAGSWVTPRDLIRKRDWTQVKKMIKMTDWKT